MRLLNRVLLKGTAAIPQAAVAAGAPARVIARHADVLRHCAGDREIPLVVAAVDRPDGASRNPLGRLGRRDVLLLTRNRLVVTTQCRFLRRLKLYLNADLHHLTDVTWTPEPELGAVKLAATAVDGVREHFLIRVGDAARVARVDELLRDAFRGRISPSRKAMKKAMLAAA